MDVFVRALIKLHAPIVQEYYVILGSTEEKISIKLMSTRNNISKLPKNPSCAIFKICIRNLEQN